MSVIQKLKLVRHGKTGVRQFCLQTIRFKKLLENARYLMDLFEDGKEKALGEYILDRRYVTTLIDNVVERLGMMVYDACVLVPGKSAELFMNYDRQVLIARKLIGGETISAENENQTGGVQTPSDPVDPEYRLLADVLQWMNGSAAPSSMSVMNFMRQTFFFAIDGIDSADRAALLADSCFKASDSPLYIVDLWRDAIASPVRPRSIHEIDCIPLEHLLADTGDDRSLPERHGSGGAFTWIAATSESQVSLSAFSPGFRFRLETTASGFEESDFIFIFTDAAANLDGLLPSGFHTEKTDYGQLAWLTGTSSKTIKDCLVAIGRNIFNKHTWQK